VYLIRLGDWGEPRKWRNRSLRFPNFRNSSERGAWNRFWKGAQRGQASKRNTVGKREDSPGRRNRDFKERKCLRKRGGETGRNMNWERQYLVTEETSREKDHFTRYRGGDYPYDDSC